MNTSKVIVVYLIRERYSDNLSMWDSVQLFRYTRNSGADTGFSKRGGLRPAIRNAGGGGGGGVSTSGPIRKARGRGGCCPL